LEASGTVLKYYLSLYYPTINSVAMIQEHYGKYIRDNGDMPLRAYAEQAEAESIGEKTETFLDEVPNYQINLASPTGFEPVLSA
jgi:hypothetical protein